MRDIPESGVRVARARSGSRATRGARGHRRPDALPRCLTMSNLDRRGQRSAASRSSLPLVALALAACGSAASATVAPPVAAEARRDAGRPRRPQPAGARQPAARPATAAARHPPRPATTSRSSTRARSTSWSPTSTPRSPRPGRRSSRPAATSAPRTSAATATTTAAVITYRIPASRWDDALGSLRGLATKVVGEQTQATEVGGQIVDLEARLRNLRASEQRAGRHRRGHRAGQRPARGPGPHLRRPRPDRAARRHSARRSRTRSRTARS